jgi:hypothetical protein
MPSSRVGTGTWARPAAFKNRFPWVVMAGKSQTDAARRPRKTKQSFDHPGRLHQCLRRILAHGLEGAAKLASSNRARMPPRKSSSRGIARSSAVAWLRKPTRQTLAGRCAKELNGKASAPAPSAILSLRRLIITSLGKRPVCAHLRNSTALRLFICRGMRGVDYSTN